MLGTKANETMAVNIIVISNVIFGIVGVCVVLHVVIVCAVITFFGLHRVPYKANLKVYVAMWPTITHQITLSFIFPCLIICLI